MLTNDIHIDNFEHACLKQTHNWMMFPYIIQYQLTFFNYNSTRQYLLLRVFYERQSHDNSFHSITDSLIWITVVRTSDSIHLFNFNIYSDVLKVMG